MPYVNGAGGGAGGAVIAFDQVLLADTAAIDTLANAIPSIYRVLVIDMQTRTDDAGAVANVSVTFNGDTGLHYDTQYDGATNNATFSAARNLAGGSFSITTHGSGGTATYTNAARLVFPNYASTTYWKVGNADVAVMDTLTANLWALHFACGWEGTAAINQVTVAAQGAAKLKAGSRVTVSLI